MTVQVEQLITEHLDLWTQAQTAKSTSGRGSNNKIELTGIKKLRELILELAVRGKLVPQDPNDEPASELLKRIAAEKEALVKVGKLKKQKPLPELKEDEKPFELPSGWGMAHLFDLVEILDYMRKPISKSERTSGIFPYYGASGIIDYISAFIFDDNLVLVGEDGAKWGVGEQTAFKVKGKCWVNNHAHVLKVNNQILLDDYLVFSINARDLSDFITGTTVPKLNQAKLSTIPIVIPPITEQQRIVAKVDELMTLCDQLEQQSYQQLDAHNQLVDALLTTLTQSQNADELASNWQRLAAHFDTLFTTEYSIDALKQTILQLAVMGKLVKQDPHDEPASELLKRIAAEKDALVKAGKIKKQKSLPPISDEEKPFELPEGWTYSRLDDLCSSVFSGSTPPQAELNEISGIPFLKVYNIQNQQIEFNNRTLFIKKDSHNGILKRSILYPGDVVMNLVGPPLGKVAIIPNTFPEWNCNQNIICFRPLDMQLNKYIYTYLKAQTFLYYVELVGSAGQDFISGTKCRAILLPTPPLAEQIRIVSKVDELMNICELLSIEFAVSKQTQAVLSEALVEQVIA